eukprot:scaffold31531_cov66-Phaeocystis_antarctica.AAC.1
MLVPAPRRAARRGGSTAWACARGRRASGRRADLPLLAAAGGLRRPCAPRRAARLSGLPRRPVGTAAKKARIRPAVTCQHAVRPKRSAAALVQRRHCATTPGRLLVSLLDPKTGVRAASQHGTSSPAGRTHLKAEARRPSA